jgi:hypothetical protein
MYNNNQIVLLKPKTERWINTYEKKLKLGYIFHS